MGRRIETLEERGVGSGSGQSSFLFGPLRGVLEAWGTEGSDGVGRVRACGFPVTFLVKSPRDGGIETLRSY